MFLRGTEGIRLTRMIVDTMTIEELGDAVIKTVQANIFGITNVLFSKDKLYKRIIIKGGEKRYDFKPLRSEADGITFYVCPYSNGKRDYKKYGLSFALFAHFFYKGTNWYALLCDNNTKVNLYQQHFFERYIERHLKDGSNVTIDTVRHYFKETDYLTNCRVTKNPKHPNCIYGATNIGVCCGYHCGRRITVWLTYIDKGTLTRGFKKDVFNESADMFTPIGTDALVNRIFSCIPNSA